MYIYKNHTEETVERIKEAAEVMLNNPYMTQKELGEMFGVSPRTIRAWVKSYEQIDMTGYKKIRANFKEHSHMERSLEDEIAELGKGLRKAGEEFEKAVGEVVRELKKSWKMRG